MAHADVADDRGKAALQRGPIVFCLEWPDNNGEVLDLVIGDDVKFRAEYRPDILAGATVIEGSAFTVKRTMDGDIVAQSERPFRAIPYCARAHCGRGQMTVWPACKPEAARPEPADTLTYRSKTTGSFVHVSLDAIKKQILPKNSADPPALQLDFWPHKEQCFEGL